MALNAELQPFADGLAQQSAQDDQQKGQIADLTDQLGKAQQQVTTLQNTITALQLDDNTAQAMAVSLSAQLSAAQAQVVTLQAKLNALQPAVIWDALQYRVWNVAGGSAADTGATGNTATFTQTVPTAAGLASRKLTPAVVAGVPGAYANAYSYLQLGPNFSITRFQQEGLFLMPAASDAAASQAVEFDLQQCDDPAASGLCFNWGVQFDFAEGLLRCWNRSGMAWMPTGTLLKRPAAGAALFCQWNVHRDAANIYYDSLQVNGVLQPNTAVQFPAPKLNLAAMINYGFQLDGNKAGTPYAVAIDRMKLTGWTA